MILREYLIIFLKNESEFDKDVVLNPYFTSSNHSMNINILQNNEQVVSHILTAHNRPQTHFLSLNRIATQIRLSSGATIVIPSAPTELPPFHILLISKTTISN